MNRGNDRFSWFTFHFAVIAALSVLLLMACANMGTPDGGPFDETPPKIVSTTPKFGEANSKATKIVIEFDEIVKIDNPMEKVVVSPPQLEQPEIEAIGKKVHVTLLDSLKPNMTYTIDFADAIADNNEGNPFGDYAFTFSTGEQIDTMQVSGNVLDASNLEPIKGMLVGLYRLTDDGGVDSVGGNNGADAKGDVTSGLPDSTFRTIPFERVSRTDSRGHFVVKGLAPGKYRAFALNDQNQNYVYDQNSEMLAFSSRILETSCKPDVRQDTVWHDSIHYDSIVSVPYTHFYPDDIVLMAFTSDKQDRHKLKEERPVFQQFSLYFTAPSDTLPLITGINFDANDAFVVDASEHNDSINYWIKDSLIYNIDTLVMRVDFYETDTLGQLVLTNDTLTLVSKLTKAKLAKQEKEKWDQWVKEYKQKLKEERRANKDKEAETLKEPDDDGDADEEKVPDMGEDEESVKDEDSVKEPEKVKELEKIKEPEKVKESEKKRSSSSKKKKKDDEDIEIPPMPEEFMEYKINNATALDPDKNIDFEFPEPLDSVDISKIHFSLRVDSLFEPAKFLFRPVPGKVRCYRLYAEWEADSTYQLEIDTAAFVSIYGKRNEATKRSIKVKSLDSYSTLFVTLNNADTSAVVQLMDGSDKVVKSVKSENGKADFYFVNPGTYYMRMYYDRNGNGKWDTGDYDAQLQPEQVFYYPDPLTLKALWEVSQSWNPNSTPLPKQKPAKITKQKPDKERNNKSKNAERERKKREGK